VGLFNPIIDTVQSGDRLVVRPTVSADRKYVTIGGQYQSSNVIAIQDFPFFAWSTRVDRWEALVAVALLLWERRWVEAARRFSSRMFR